MSIDQQQLKRIIEAAIFAADAPLSEKDLKKLFEEFEAPSNDELKTALTSLQEESEARGVELKKVASGWRFQVREELGNWVGKLWEEKPQRYTRALLETLALIAYRQPVTRGEIEEVRGVSVSSQIIRTLLEREWVQVIGHKDVPGRPAMYATTRHFLDYFNLESLNQLPSLSEIRSLEDIAKDAEDVLAEAAKKAGLAVEDVLEHEKTLTASDDLGVEQNEESANHQNIEAETEVKAETEVEQEPENESLHDASDAQNIDQALIIDGKTQC